jgi:hypothetical protein
MRRLTLIDVDMILAQCAGRVPRDLTPRERAEFNARQIARQLEHRGSAEELASGLEKAADAGLRAQAGVAIRSGSDA